jgi:predicted GH43/DUF377 family glycosyl hydrolase
MRKQRLLILLFIGLLLMQVSCTSKFYLFSSFHEPANEGLRFLVSKDGYHWNACDTIFLKPTIGKDKIMRDPSILQGPDGIFHLVWTTEWKGGNGFGYAHSKDLVNWSDQKYIPIMEKEKTVANVWAPELFYDDLKKEYIIVWASCIPFRFPKVLEDENNNHRLYYTTTKDFNQFSEVKLFLDPGFSAIDAVIVQKNMDNFVLVLKDNTRLERNIKIAISHQALGPYSQASKPFTPNFSEGPAVAKVNNGWLIYYDAYQKKKFGAVFTKDFQEFKNVDSLISIPEGHKHGTIISVKKKYLKTLFDFSANKHLYEQ